MKFCQYETMEAATRALAKADGFILPKEEIAHITKTAALPDPIGRTHWYWEQKWKELGQPYYDVYPIAIEMMTKVNLDKITGDMLRAPGGMPAVLLRFPDAPHKLGNERFRARTMWVHLHDQGSSDRTGESNLPMLSFGMDYGEAPDGTLGGAIFSVRNIPLNELTLTDMHNQLAEHQSLMIGEPMEHELMLEGCRLACMLCLLNNSEELISPVLLTKDAHKAPTPQLVAKAKRRGKHAYSIGAGLTVAPHVRRPHLHTYLTGKGRKVPIVKMIGHDKPIIVHRKKIENVPTGYLTKDKKNDS